MAYRKVMAPITVRGLGFPNRIVMAPMHTNLADEDGRVTDALIDFYRPMVTKGVGTVIVGAVTVESNGKITPRNLCAFDDGCIEGFSRLFRMISENGGIPGVQLYHAGRQRLMHVDGEPAVAPSAVPAPFFESEVRELRRDEIFQLEDRFAAAASLLWRAGARLVEIHCAHGFLLNQFISPASNRRGDEYGGSLENRLRVVLNVLRKVRSRVDERLVISCRISSEEFVADGIALEEGCAVASALAENGADLIHASGGVAYASGPMMSAISEGKLVENAAAIKERLEVPVIAVGGINSLKRAENILDSGGADLIAMARALVADPEIVTKSLAGREDEVNTCDDCNQCYLIVSPGFPPIQCTLRELR